MNSAPHEFEPFIRYIRFPRYKQLAEDERIDFEFPFTALVGPNGCNKSAVLQALYGCPEGNNTGIYWFSTDVDVISEKSGRHCFIHGYWSDNANDVVEALKTRIHRKDNPDYWEPSRPIKKYGMKGMPPIDDSNMKDRTETRWKAIMKDVLYLDLKSQIGAFDKFFWHSDFQKTETINTKQDYIRHKSKYIRIIINKNLNSYTYYGKEKIRKNILLSKDACKSVSYILGQDYKSIRLIEHSFYGNQFAPTVILSRAGLQYSEAFAGSGETVIVVLVQSILSAPPKSLILLYEPETSLHPKAQHKLKEFLLDQIIKHKHQIIVSTHSPAMIESLPPKAIKVMYFKQETGVKINPISFPEEAFEVIGTTDANKLIIYVEDKLSKTIIDVCIEKFKNNLKSFIEVKYIPGGAESIIKYLVSNAAIASHKNTFFVFDGDMCWRNRKPINKECRDRISSYMVNNKIDESLIPEADNRFLDDIVKELVGCEIHLYLDGNPSTGSNRNQRIRQLRKFIKYWLNNVHFLPGMKPEGLLYDSVSDEFRHVFFKDVEKPEEVDWKEYFKSKTVDRLVKTDVNSDDILLIERQVVAKFKDDCEVFKKIRDIIDSHFENRDI